MSLHVKSIAKMLFAILIAAVIALPLGFVLTIVLMPVSLWFEATFGIESVGHSGPAGWCFMVTILTVFVALAAWLMSISTASRRPRANS